MYEDENIDYSKGPKDGDGEAVHKKLVDIWNEEFPEAKVNSIKILQTHDVPVTDKWPDHVVYHVYRNDDLTKLPIPILEQMRNHINDVISGKRLNNKIGGRL